MALINRLWTHFSGDTKQLRKQSDALKIGILGAANICDFALLNPASKLTNVLVYGIAARDRRRAESFARKHHIPKVYENYDELLADPEINAIYNPLPNGLHYEWSIKALRCGKHVLCEKPMSNNSAEAFEMVEEARTQNRLLVEAFHYRYHPICNETLREILSNKDRLGEVEQISSRFCISRKFLKRNDIRFDFSLGGGTQMDLGCYLVSMCRFIVTCLTGSQENQFEVIKAEALRVDKTNPEIDYGMRTELKIDNVPCELHCEFTEGFSLFKQEILVRCEKSTIKIANLIGPQFYHYVTIEDRKTNRQETIKNYAENQSTYFYQLKSFVDAVRLADKGSMGEAYKVAFTTGEDGIKNMKIIDEIYQKSGLVRRGTKINDGPILEST